MIAHLDCSSGVSGDKFLGALIDAGFAIDELREGLGSLGISADDVVVQRVISGGIAAKRVGLTEEAEAASQPLRRLGDIRALIFGAGLPGAVADSAVRVFELLAEAEAHVHGTSIDEVHFHELSALDTIFDIVGVALGLEALKVDELVATPPALGSGTVQTEHGMLPVPSPATVQLLLGVPAVAGPDLPGVEPAGELTTPTGAALVRAFATSFGSIPPMTPKVTGYGAGTRDLGFPNVARIVIGESLDTATALDQSLNLATEQVVVLETNIDHLTPEKLAFCCEELLSAGALDVWQTPIVMKKGRAAVMLGVICSPAEASQTAARIHDLTGSLGVRRRESERTVLPREQRIVDTRHGPVHVKITRHNGRPHGRPEYEDVARIARETGESMCRILEDLAADIAATLLLP